MNGVVAYQHASSRNAEQGVKKMEGSPIALELRRMQMLSEIGIDNNTTTVILMPSEFSNAAKSFSDLVNKKKVNE